MDGLEATLRRMLDLAGVVVSETVEAPVTTSPLEPLLGEPPSVWLYAAAFHIGDIEHGCRSVLSDLAEVTLALDSSKPWPDEVWTSLWSSVGDMRFHAHTFPLYGDMIREILLGKIRSDRMVYLRVQPTETRRASEFPVEALAQHVSNESASLCDCARDIAADLRDLAEVCEVSIEAIEGLRSASEMELTVLAVRFAFLQSVLLELARVLLRADVAASLLMHYAED